MSCFFICQMLDNSRFFNKFVGFLTTKHMRQFFKMMTAVILSVFCLAGCQNNQKAKYIFLFIGDGMGATHVAVTESYLSYKEGKLGGEQLLMTQFPYYGTATSHSANANITDSAASGTAIACGEKANNGTVGINKDSVNIESVAYALKKDGYKIGIMSTVPINHATPSAFYAHNIKRSNYYEISCDIPGSGFDFFAGAGFLDYKGKNNDLVPIDSYLEENGYSVSYGLDEFRTESMGKDKAIFCQASNRDTSAGNYINDGSVAADATMAEMLELGLEFIGDKEPFFFMCEGGAIDWAAHANRTMPLVENVLDFDAAIKVAYEFYKKHPKQTLIVVTADHETGGLSLGCGSKKVDWEKLENEWIESGKKSVMGNEENLQFNKECSIGWTNRSHTGGAVPVFAVGVGAEKFNGRMDNTDIKGKILGE